MKKDILKIAGVKSEKEFYKKYPTEEAFMKAHGKAFKKAAMGRAMVKDQDIQLTDFSNPPIAQKGIRAVAESTATSPQSQQLQAKIAKDQPAYLPDDPFSKYQLKKKGYSDDQIAVMQNAQWKEQPVVQPGKATTKATQENKRKKLESFVAEDPRYKIDANGDVTTTKFGDFMRNYGKNTDKFDNDLLEAVNYGFTVPGKLTQSQYKKGYTVEDALMAKPNDANFLEDLVTDPTLAAELPLMLGKGLLKLGLKGGLKAGVKGAAHLAAALPFYKMTGQDAHSLSRFNTIVDRLKNIVASPEAKDVFKNIGDVFAGNKKAEKIDPNYIKAITDPELPIRAIDKYANSIMSTEAGENALTPEQLKYLGSLGSLAVDFDKLPYNSSAADQVKWLIENSKDLSPRDLQAFLYHKNVRELLTPDQKKALWHELYNNYDQAVDNPMAEYTAAGDLLSLAEAKLPQGSSLSNELKSLMYDAVSEGQYARPQFQIADEYYEPILGNNDNAQEAIHGLFRYGYNTIPTKEQRAQQTSAAVKQIMKAMNETIGNPDMKGKTIVASHSLSGDSYPMGLRLIGAKQNEGRIIPVHEGSAQNIFTTANTLSGISNYNKVRTDYMSGALANMHKRLGLPAPPPPINRYGQIYFQPGAGIKEIQGQLTEAGMLNSAIDAFNKKIGTNLPSAQFTGYGHKRPNVGIIPHEQGGVVRKAQVGAYIGGDATGFKGVDYNNIYGNLDSSLGISDQQEAMRNKVEAQKQEQEKGNTKGGSGIDPQQAMQLAMMFAKRGAKVRKAQVGDQLGFVDDSGLVQAPGGMVTQGQTDYLESQTVNPPGVQQPPNQPQQKQSKSLATTSGGLLLDKGINALGPIGKPIGQVVNSVRKVSQSVKQANAARQAGVLSKIALQESGMRPEQTKRRYVRPEDALLNSTYGVGTNFLQAEDGAEIGGNETEIQNTYNPGDLYSDLGYVPLSLNNNKVKQYKKGGKTKKAEDGQGLLNVGDKTMGIANQIGKGFQIAGDITSGIIDMGTEHRMKQNMRNAQQAAFQQGMRGIQNQNMAFMEDGGWVSNDWQPQVITKFGDYDVKDLFAPDKEMDTLRAGGHLKSYTPPSQEALDTAAMGGQLNTTWGGYAEPISHNPYLPGTGETVMFRGKSHEESDGNGHTGIGVKYGKGAQDSYTDYAEYGTEQADADVEVERGEPATELPDSETGDNNLVVFGNMKIPSYGVSELGDKKAKNRKFKHYANDLSKSEALQNKKIEKAMNIINSFEPESPFDILKFNSAKATIYGANLKQQELANKKKTLAGIQNAILETAEEHGLDSDSLAKGKIKKAKASDMAKFGKKLKKAQSGILTRPEDGIPSYRTYVGLPDPLVDRWANLAQSVANRTQPVSPVSFPPMGLSETPKATFKQISEGVVPDSKDLYHSNYKSKSWFDKAVDIYDDAYSSIRPGIKNPLSPSQIMPEMYELATNQLEAVQAQSFAPLLEDNPAVSFQDRRNEVQSQVNAALRQAGSNPAAVSEIMARAYDAKNQINAEEFRTNQMMQAESRRRNIATLNDAALKNLAIFDQQYERQARAKSATKAQAHEALASIAEKIGKNKAETLAANVTANMYPQYSWGPNGRIYNTGVTNYNIPTVAPDGTPTDDKGNDLIPIYGKSMNDIKGYKVKPKKNGAIVKAIKNL